MKFNGLTYNISLGILLITALYTLVYSGLTGLLLCSSVSLIAATAHMIGKDYPTAADFANLMHSPQFSHGGSQFASVVQQPPPQQPTLIETTKGNMYSDITSQIKQPLLVAIIVFIVSLPIINVLIGHYLPSLLRIGGDLTTAGLVVKSLIGGFLFWFIQKVLVPLMVV